MLSVKTLIFLSLPLYNNVHVHVISMSSVNPFRVSNTVQIKVSLDIAEVLTMFTVPYIL